MRFPGRVRPSRSSGQVEVVTQARGSRAVLTVANTGPVVPAAAIDRLFQPFQRPAADRTGHGDGRGLGLSIVQAIAGAHHAAITAHPQPRGGLLIDVNFPAGPAGGAFTSAQYPSGEHLSCRADIRHGKGAGFLAARHRD